MQKLNVETVAGTKTTILRSFQRVRMEAELVLPVGSTAGAGGRPPCVAEATPIAVRCGNSSWNQNHIILSNHPVGLIGGSRTGPRAKVED